MHFHSFFKLSTYAVILSRCSVNQQFIILFPGIVVSKMILSFNSCFHIQGFRKILPYWLRRSDHSTIISSSLPRKEFQQLRAAVICFTSHWMYPMLKLFLEVQLQFQDEEPHHRLLFVSDISTKYYTTPIINLRHTLTFIHISLLVIIQVFRSSLPFQDL